MITNQQVALILRRLDVIEKTLQQIAKNIQRLKDERSATRR